MLRSGDYSRRCANRDSAGEMTRAIGSRQRRGRLTQAVTRPLRCCFGGEVVKGLGSPPPETLNRKNLAVEAHIFLVPAYVIQERG